MRNFKLTKQIEKDLKQIANGLPVLYDRSTVDQLTLGRDLKLTGFTVNNKGEELQDDKFYPLPMPVMIHRNHYRRLKKAFESGGEPLVIEYITKTKKECVELESQE